MIKLASWNVNSLKIRLEHVLNWLESTSTDILALQETKLPDEAFPIESFLERGFHVVFSGQKSYNGVAIISRHPLTDRITDIPDWSDPQRRILAVTVGNIRLINLYVPNGSEVGSEKYQYKLTWLNHVNAFIQQQLENYTHLAVVGDFNIAPEDCDAHDPIGLRECILLSTAERIAFNQLLDIGLTDSFRLFPQDEKSYSWWDYRSASFRRNLGLRIDHILLSKSLVECCTESRIDRAPRKLERPSDHAPVWVTLNHSF